MNKYKVDINGIDTNNLKVLKKNEMDELFKRFNDGDERAKEELVNGNLKLVYLSSKGIIMAKTT